MSIDKDLLDKLMEGQSAGDLFGKEAIPSELTKAMTECALRTEMEEHLGDERADEASEGQNQAPNRRNGRSQKTVTTDSGKVAKRLCGRLEIDEAYIGGKRPGGKHGRGAAG